MAYEENQGQLARRCACMHGGRQRKPRSRTIVSDEMMAMVIDHVVNHGLSMSEAGLRVQPNLPLTVTDQSFPVLL